MKRLLILALLCGTAWGAAPTWVKTVCSNWSASSGSTIACTGTVASAGDFIVVHVGDGYSPYPVTSVIETGNATGYVSSNVACTDASATKRYEQWGGFVSASGSRTFTATASGSSIYHTIIVSEYSGVPTSGYLDTGASAHFCTSDWGNAGYSTYPTLTTTSANSLIVCGIGAANGSAPFTAGTGFSHATSVGAGAADPNLGEEDRTTTYAGVYGATIGLQGNYYWAGGCAAYNSIAVAADYSISGPSSGYVNTTSSIFTITDSTGNWGSTPKTITISDGGNAGTVTLATCTGTGSGTTPAALSLTGGTTCTFTYTPVIAGTLTLLSAIHSGTDPAPNTYTYTSITPGGYKSVTPSGPINLSVAIPNVAPYNAFTAASPMRWEFRVHNFGADVGGDPGFGRLGGEATVYSLGGGALEMSVRDIDGSPYTTAMLCCAGLTDILVRVQRDPVLNRWTLEKFDTVGGGYLSEVVSGFSFTAANLAGETFFVSSPRTAFVRWYSSVVPLGTTIPLVGTGDLGDWEFDGNLNDSSGHGLNMTDSGGATYTTTPTYPPSCNAGAMQSFRAGYSGTLDGTSSQPLDGGSGLTYSWQRVSGPAVSWTGTTTATPALSAIAAGSYTLGLTVTDGSSQSSGYTVDGSCTVNDGAVTTDANGVVQGLPAQVTDMLGPLIRYGANQWPWFDDRHKTDADVQIANMDPYYGAWWDVADTGTVTVAVSSDPYARDWPVVGSGTTFTTTFCNGPSDPTTPNGKSIVIWYPTGITGQTGRRMANVSGCSNDTHLTLNYAWTPDVLGGSGLSYSDNANYGTWAYNALPANYYDNVAAFYALYYRSGIIDYLNAARKLADRFWVAPEMDRGMSYNPYGTGGGWPGRSRSMLGLVLRALDGHPEMFTGLEKIWQTGITYSFLPGSSEDTYLPALWDVREVAYELAELSYCALYDTSSMQATCQSKLSTIIPGYFTSTKMPDGGWAELVAHMNSWNTSPVTTVTLVHGSAAVVGNGTSWDCGYFPTSGMRAYAWFLPTSSKPVNNAGGDPVAYTATCSDGQHLTLDRPYEGTSGTTHGWAISIPAADTPYVGYGSYVYMEGLLAMAFDYAAKALAVSDPTNAALARSYNLSAATWMQTYGYRASQKSVFYGVQFVNCQAPIVESAYSPCTNTYSGSGARVISSEAIRGLMAAYAYSKDPSLGAYIDVLYNAMWAKPGTCPSGSTVCVPDGVYLDQFDDGGVDISGTPPGGAAPKWFGQMWGISSLSSWPATRPLRGPSSRSVSGRGVVSGAGVVR